MNDTRSKQQVAESIIRQEFYSKDSGFYRRMLDRLMKLPMSTLTDLDLILVMRVVESNELTRKVDSIMNRS